MDIRLGAVREEDVVFSATGHTHTGGADGENIPTSGIVDGAINLAKSASRRGAFVKRSAGQSIPTAALTTMNWDAEEYDTDNIHDNVTNNSRLTVPAGITQVRVSGQVRWEGNATGERQFIIQKNGVNVEGAGAHYIPAGTTSNRVFGATTPALSVVAGDYFTAVVFQSSGVAIEVQVSGETWFAMELLK